MTLNPSPFPPKLLGALLVLCAVVAFLPAIGAGYIWDDNILLTENPNVRSPHGPVEIWQGKNSREYTPLSTSSFWLEWRLWGDTPTGYHVVNILLHALSAVALAVLESLGIPGAWWRLSCLRFILRGWPRWRGLPSGRTCFPPLFF